MLLVMNGRKAFIHFQKLHRQNAEAFFLIALDDISGMMFGKCIWFD